MISNHYDRLGRTARQVVDEMHDWATERGYGATTRIGDMTPEHCRDFLNRWGEYVVGAASSVPFG